MFQWIQYRYYLATSACKHFSLAKNVSIAFIIVKHFQNLLKMAKVQEPIYNHTTLCELVDRLFSLLLHDTVMHPSIKYGIHLWRKKTQDDENVEV